MGSDVHFDVVRLCATTDADEEALQSRLTRENALDWERIFDLAYYHRVQPLVHRTLRRLACVDAFDHPGWELFCEEARAARARGEFGLDELRRVLRLFERADIPALTFKGPVLGHLAYGEVGLRSSVDLDVLVPPRAMDAIDALLRDDGYRRLNADASPLRRRIRFFFEREHHYAQGPAVYNLDIHATPVKPSFAYRTSFEALYRRARPVTIGRRRFLAPSAEDLLLILCYHGAKDRWSRLKRICDINELVRSCPHLDWNVLLTRAEALHAARILSLGLHLARRVFDLPLPPRVSEFITERQVILRWGDALEERLSHRIDDREWGSLSERVTYPLAVQDTLRHKARYALYTGAGKLVSVIT